MVFCAYAYRSLHISVDSGYIKNLKLKLKCLVSIKTNSFNLQIISAALCLKITYNKMCSWYHFQGVLY